MLLSGMAALFYKPPAEPGNFSVPPSWPPPGNIQLPNFGQSNGFKWYPTVICIFLTTDEFEHLFTCRLFGMVSSSVTCLF